MLTITCALLAGCNAPDLPKSWRITYARVLATRAEVVGDETRATPKPGERARVRVLVVSGEPVARVSYVLRVCPTALPNGELPRCTGEVIALDESKLETQPRLDHELVLMFDVPDEDALEDAPLLLVQGTICTDGDAHLDEHLNARCAGGDAEPLTWVDHIVIARSEDERNANPVFAADALELDGELWSESLLAFPDAVTPDEDAGVAEPDVDAGTARALDADGKEHEITLTLTNSARETTDEGREELLLSHFVTTGKLERRFSVLERGDADDLALHVKWNTPPADHAPARMLAAFVMRDQRGGVAYTVRALDLQ